jgi:hypothetical protein
VAVRADGGSLTPSLSAGEPRPPDDSGTSALAHAGGLLQPRDASGAREEPRDLRRSRLPRLLGPAVAGQEPRERHPPPGSRSGSGDGGYPEPPFRPGALRSRAGTDTIARTSPERGSLPEIPCLP